MEINEDILLKNGYKYYPNEKIKMCDRYYQKTISKEPTKVIAVLYYDTFDGEALDYSYEFVLIEEKDKYWSNRHIYGIDKDLALEEIERILLGE